LQFIHETGVATGGWHFTQTTARYINMANGWRLKSRTAGPVLPAKLPAREPPGLWLWWQIGGEPAASNWHSTCQPADEPKSQTVQIHASDSVTKERPRLFDLT